MGRYEKRATLKSKNCVQNSQKISNITAALLLFATLLFLILPACSKDNGSTLSRIKKTGQIRFGVEGTYPPFNFYNGKKELVGFDVDVAREIALRLHVEPVFVDKEWGKIIPGLNTGEYDCIVASMAVTEERLKQVNFSEPYYYSSSQLIVRSDAAFQNLEDLKRKTIGVVAGTTYEIDAKKLGADPILVYKDDYQCLHELHLGILDGVITDKVLGAYLKNRGQFKTKLLGPPLRQEKIAVAFRKDDDALLRKVSKILKAMHKDGTLNSLISKVAQGGYN